MDIISKHKRNKVVSDGILTLSFEADQAKQMNPNIINATIGMFFTEEYSFHSFPIVQKTIGELNAYEMFSYQNTDGGKTFHKAVQHWLFDDQLETVLTKTNVQVLATPGGSGAIAVTVANVLEQGDTMLLPDIMWSPYQQFLVERQCQYETYSLYQQDGLFSIVEFEKVCLRRVKSDGKLVVLINDPCHNPTGFCLTDQNYQHLFDVIECISKDYPTTVLFDCAYLDMYPYSAAIRTRLTSFVHQPNALVLYAMSGSKTLGLYGLRVGALVAVCKDQKVLEQFYSAAEYTARATWSNVSHLGIRLLEKIMLEPDKHRGFIKELEEVRTTLGTRAEVFLRISREIGLRTSSYESGFFICVPCENPHLLAKKLIEEKIYVCPLLHEIRIAFSCISISEAACLPKIILSKLGEC